MTSTFRLIFSILVGGLGLQAMLGNIAMGDTRLYRCEVRGKATYSDKPCPDSAVQSEVAVDGLNTYEAASTPSKVPDPSARGFKSKTSRSRTDELISGSIAADLQQAKQRCQRIADRLETVRVKLGQGHTAEQATRLHEQRRQLEAQKRSEKCR